MGFPLDQNVCGVTGFAGKGKVRRVFLVLPPAKRALTLR
jgi:hypothetical protein